MKKISVTPLVSAGEIKFGMERVRAREILGNFSEYKNHPDDTNTADCFELCHLFYGNDDIVEFIMFYRLDKVEISWGEKILTNMSKAELVDFFSKIDMELSVENYGYGIVSFASNSLGIACSFMEDLEFDEDGNEAEIEKVETISLAVRDYWK